MYAKDLISSVIPAIKTSDTGDKALSWMEFFKVSHLPIVNNKDFLGLISESDIYNLNCGKEAIGNHKLSLIRPFVTEDQHIWEILELVKKMDLSIVPVLTEKESKYMGSITLPDLIKQTAITAGTENNGSIIVLEMGIRDYSLNEISMLAEENNIKILSLYVSGAEDSMRINVTIKVDTTDVTSFIQSLNRYDYTIRASFMTEDNMENFYRDRYESFLSYLNV